ncbi:acyltransferase family protein [Streptomyces anatolicus]|nr:acyltransferase [Streptomyces anatolicus]
MRCASSAVVFILHIIQAGVFADLTLSESLNKYFGKIGFVSVGFFFLLSGFILTWSAREGDRPVSFWRRRLARIYPTHLLVCAAAVVLLAARDTSPAWGDTLPSLFLVQGWTSNETVFWGVNGPSWSLCAELLFYLAFPLLLRVIRKIPDRWLWLCAGSLVAAVFAVAFVARLVVSPDPEMPFINASWDQQWAVFNHPATRMLDFTLGIVMARILQAGLWIRIPLGAALLTLIPGYVCSLWLPGTFGLVAPTTIPLALIVTAAAAADLSGKRTVFQGRTMVRLGELAFSFYLTHTLVIIFGPIGRAERTWPLPQALGMIALTYALSLAVAWVVCHGFERPVARRLAKSRRPPAPSADSAGGAGPAGGPAVEPKADLKN